MLKNMSLGMKIGGGFGVLIIISMLLGGVAVYNMKHVGGIAESLESELAPQVDLTVQVERACLGTMFEMRGYFASHDPKDWEKGSARLAEMEKALGNAADLAQKHPSLGALKDNVAKAQS